MTTLERWNHAVMQAACIVSTYRAAAPEGCDPLNFEGVVAAGLAAAAVSAGAAAYSSSQSAGAQEDMASALGKKPKIVPASFEDPSTAYNEYNTLFQSEYPQMEKDANTFNTTDNSNYQKMLSASSPSLLAGIKTQGTDANSLLQGQIPADVQSELLHNSAYQNLTNGLTGSTAGRAATARDFGTTSLSLMNQGSTMLGANLANAKAVNPYDFTGDSLLLTPQQELSRDDSNAAYANGVLNANQNIQYQNSLYNTAANSYSPFGAATLGVAGSLSGGTTQNLVKSLGSSFGSGSSGNDNGGSYLNSSAGAYDQNSSYATSGGGGTYNPFLDTNNYADDGSFIGNPNSYGGG